MKRYKYIEKQYALTMMDKGEIKIGTGYGYRESDNKEVEDMEELMGFDKRSVSGIFPDTASLPAAAQKYIEIKPGSTVELHNVGVTTQYEAPDAYMYCVTRAPTVEGMKAFNCDACIEITDLIAFYRVIRKWMFAHKYTVKKSAVGPCNYNGRILFPGEPIDNFYWKKDPRLEHQQEDRIVMLPRKDRVPIKVDVYIIPEIKKFVKLYNF
jgi:hypothetical protein